MGSEARARLGLLGLLLITLLSYAQVFAGGDYPGPALLGMMVAVGVTILGRRLGLRSLPTFLLSAAGMAWYLVLIFQARQSFYGLPSWDALEGLVTSVTRALEHSNVDYAPVPVRPGYVILVVAGMWLLTTLGEIATFRWKRPLLASVGPVVTFSFVAIVGTRTGILWLVGAFLAALFTYWGLESSHRLRLWGRWMPAWSDHPEEPPPTVTGALARRMGAGCVAAALVAPIFLPGLSDSLLPWRSGSGGGGFGIGGGEINPLVQLQPQLIEQSDQELFVVTADRPAYWKLISLADFDGNEWTPVGVAATPVIGGVITTNAATATRSQNLTQNITITGLEGNYVPAATQASSISFAQDPMASGEGVTVNPEGGDVRLDGQGVFEGLGYEVDSVQPALGFDEMKHAVPGNPGTSGIYTDLPSDMSEEVRELARLWVADAETPFDQLLAIQDRLRGFNYSHEVEPAASSDYLTEFLLETRTGYCQQFATAFALLARFHGFAARVAVGFLPGQTDVASPNRYSVRGTDAHAWPEVYFEDYGWVAFEPTPRQGVTQPRYTIPNTPAPQLGARLDPSEQQQLRGSLRDTVEGVQNVCAGDPTCASGVTRDLFAQPGAGSRRGTPQWVKDFTRIAIAALAALLLFLLSVPSLKKLRVARRYRKAATPEALAAAAFAEFQDEASELARPRSPAESAAEYARTIVAMKKVPRQPALRLATIYEAAEYARSGIAGNQAGEARRLARELRSRLWQSSSWWRRGARLFSPRGLGLGRS
ncbi:MAG: DUF3488 and transglutaminase-like domain-containing protein [Actinomycetota bacterium]|nr:DUF3488 and transglutaminase-like domain-containing protein [Actinomycetota bacterium]